MTTNKPTPETDAFLKDRDCGNRPVDCYGDDWSHNDIEELVYLARKLERERNEARDNLRDYKTAYIINTNEAAATQKERDQLRKVVDELANSIVQVFESLKHIQIYGEPFHQIEIDAAEKRAKRAIETYNQLPHVKQRNENK